MPDENSLDEEGELCSAELLLPYGIFTSVRLTTSTTTAPTNKTIERCRLNKKEF
jgi:hypothetical protein